MSQDKSEQSRESAYKESIKQMVDQVRSSTIIERIYYYISNMLDWEKDREG